MAMWTLLDTQSPTGNIQYRVSNLFISSEGALIDRADVHVINKSDRQVDLMGIDNHQVWNLKIVS